MYPRIVQTLLFLASCLLCPVLAEEPIASPAGGKKIIHYGWDLRDPIWVRDQIQQMEKQPFDGTIMRCFGVKDSKGKKVATQLVLTDQRFERASFDRHVQAMKDTKFERFTDNFLIVWGSCRKRTGARWYDDAFWETVCHNVGVIAAVAREGGLKGICFDAEPYLGVNTWGYRNQPDAEQYDFRQYYAQARKRGRQFMTAIQENYPDLDILLFFGPFSLWPAVESPDPMEYLSTFGWGLYVGFMQGWLDVIEGQTTLHDGNELGYYYHNPADFDRARRKTHAELPQLFDPATRETYRQHVLSGSGLMFDFRPYNPNKLDENFLTPDRFERNLIWSIRASDRYTWVYHQDSNWWTDQEKKPFPPDEYRQALLNARFRTSRQGWTHRKWYGPVVPSVPEKTDPPAIDGKADDPAWAKAAVLELTAPDGGQAPAGTNARVLVDEEAIYLAWTCQEPPKKPAANQPIDKQPRVSLCITDNRGTWPYYLFEFAITGQQRSRFRELDGLGLDWQAQAARHGEAWTVEMKIPWKTMHWKKPDTHEPFRGQLLRYDADGLIESWAPTRPGKIDFLHFGEWIVR